MSKALIDLARFVNSEEGYARLMASAARWAQRRWAVEGCHGAAGPWRSGWSPTARRCWTFRPSWLPGPGLLPRTRPKIDKDDAVSIGCLP